MVLKEKLKAIKMAKTNSAATYLTKITLVRDELAAVGETIAPTELVRIALNGLPKTWENFLDGIVARENLPDWQRLWDDFIQNEIRKNHLGATKQVEEDDNVALLARGRRAEQRNKLPIVEANEKVKLNCRTRRTIPKSNVGIVKSWDTMLLGIRRRRKRKGKTNPWQLLREIRSGVWVHSL